MKILIITGLHPEKNNLASGIFITRRIKKLQEHGIDYDLFFFSERTGLHSRLLKRALKRPSFKEKSAIKVGGIQYNPLPVGIGLGDMIFYHERIGKLLVDAVKSRINLKEYDLVHAHWAYPHGYAASLLKKEFGIPCIVSAHGSDIHTNPQRNMRSISSIVFALENANRVIFNNSVLLETAKKLGYHGDNSVVIPNGVETSLFFPMEKDKVRMDLGLPPPDTRIVGFVGSLKRVKRADCLPDIFKRIAQKNSNLRFVVVGDGKLRRNLEKRCSSYKLDVIFTSRVDPEKMPFWMSALDVLLLPSRKEGFPNVCIEAQSCGCPVVGSDAGGIPEAVGEGGIIVQDTGVNFVKDFCDAVNRLLEKPLPVYLLRKRALLFNWDSVIKKQIAVYEDVLAKGVD